ncbi:uncharacterized protein LOC143300449 isoform X2 [Babylonia areolata]|uniref:uncharacterized protein LOC143300449 isoform X2 n=1 Tax=Babylonia areolata TaxID=304850 RepID=UPI003FD3D2F8
MYGPLNMSIPTIHCCSKLTSENTALWKKVRQLKQAKEDMEEKLGVLVEKNKMEALLRAYCTTRDSSTQTEVRLWTSRSGYGVLPSRPEYKSTEADLDKTNKMINMHAQLLRRYEKEVKQNMTQAETISEMTVKIIGLEKQLKEEQEKITVLERQLWALRGPRHTGKTTERQSCEMGCVDDWVLRDVVEERNKLSKENKKLRQELKGLDKVRQELKGMDAGTERLGQGETGTERHGRRN